MIKISVQAEYLIPMTYRLIIWDILKNHKLNTPCTLLQVSFHVQLVESTSRYCWEFGLLYLSSKIKVCLNNEIYGNQIYTKNQFVELNWDGLAEIKALVNDIWWSESNEWFYGACIKWTTGYHFRGQIITPWNTTTL